MYEISVPSVEAHFLFYTNKVWLTQSNSYQTCQNRVRNGSGGQEGFNSSFQVQSITASLRAHPLSRSLSNSYSQWLHDPVFKCSLCKYYFCPCLHSGFHICIQYGAVQMTTMVRPRCKTMKPWSPETAPTVVPITRFQLVLQNNLHICSRGQSNKIIFTSDLFMVGIWMGGGGGGQNLLFGAPWNNFEHYSPYIFSISRCNFTETLSSFVVYS